MQKISQKSIYQQPVALLRAALNAFVGNPVILYPFLVTAFIQLLALEILYFAPRFPLVLFFGPIIKRVWGEIFLHYPTNFLLLPKLFYYVQLLISIFIGSFLTAVAIYLIEAVNSDKKTNFGLAAKELLPRYAYIFIASLFSLGLFALLAISYGKLTTLLIYTKSQSESILFLKKIVFLSEPYVGLLLGILATVAFAFLVPVVVLERKGIRKALKANFEKLRKSFGFIFIVVLLPTLLYVPVFLLRNNVFSFPNTIVPSLHLFVIVFSVMAAVFIDATVFTAITTYYLLKREEE